MGKKRKELSHEEIWDDSALVDSWNEAYEEYKYYHSLHARGEKVKDILDAYEHDEAGKVDVVAAALPAAATVASKQANTSSKDNVHDESSAEEGEIDGGDEEEEHQEELENEIPFTETYKNDNITAQPATVEAVPTSTDHPAPLDQSKDPSVNEVSDGLHTAMNSSTQNPALKSLMMSWYWAGYYTGLHEGQQQQQQQQANGNFRSEENNKQQ